MAFDLMGALSQSLQKVKKQTTAPATAKPTKKKAPGRQDPYSIMVGGTKLPAPGPVPGPMTPGLETPVMAVDQQGKEIEPMKVPERGEMIPSITAGGSTSSFGSTTPNTMQYGDRTLHIRGDSSKDETPPPSQQDPMKEAWSGLTDQYSDIMKQHEGSWKQKQDLANAQMAAFQRRADAMSAQSGRAAFSGGAMGMGRQAMIQGMQHMSQQRAAHDQQSRQLQLAWLDKQMQQAQRDQDFTRQKELQQLSQTFAAQQADDARAHEIDLLEQELSATVPNYRTADELAFKAAVDAEGATISRSRLDELKKQYGII